MAVLEMRPESPGGIRGRLEELAVFLEGEEGSETSACDPAVNSSCRTGGDILIVTQPRAECVLSNAGPAWSSPTCSLCDLGRLLRNGTRVGSRVLESGNRNTQYSYLPVFVTCKIDVGRTSTWQGACGLSTQNQTNSFIARIVHGKVEVFSKRRCRQKSGRVGGRAMVSNVLAPQCRS